MVAFGDRAPEGKNLTNAAELDAADGAGDFGEPVVEADVGVMQPVGVRRNRAGVFPFHPIGQKLSLGTPAFHPIDKDLSLGTPALISEAAESFGMGEGMGQNGAAFTGGDLLVGIEAEDGEIAKSADASLMKFGTDRFAGVFNDYEVVPGGEVAKAMHVRGNAEGVDYEDGAGSRGQRAFNCGGCEVESDRVDVGEDGCGANVKDGVGYGDEGERGDDDFIAFSDAESEQGHVQACGAAADCDGVGDGVVCGQSGFERREFGTEAEMRSAQDCSYGSNFCFGDVG